MTTTDNGFSKRVKSVFKSRSFAAVRRDPGLPAFSDGSRTAPWPCIRRSYIPGTVPKSSTSSGIVSTSARKLPQHAALLGAWRAGSARGSGCRGTMAASAHDVRMPGRQGPAPEVAAGDSGVGRAQGESVPQFRTLCVRIMTKITLTTLSSCIHQSKHPKHRPPSSPPRGPGRGGERAERGGGRARGQAQGRGLRRDGRAAREQGAAAPTGRRGARAEAEGTRVRAILPIRSFFMIACFNALSNELACLGGA